MWFLVVGNGDLAMVMMANIGWSRFGLIAHFARYTRLLALSLKMLWIAIEVSIAKWQVYGGVFWKWERKRSMLLEILDSLSAPRSFWRFPTNHQMGVDGHKQRGDEITTAYKLCCWGEDFVTGSAVCWVICLPSFSISCCVTRLVLMCFLFSCPCFAFLSRRS